MTKAERTRQFIIKKTAPLFNKKGYEATSLSDLIDVTGLTKGALYGNFKDKEEISMEAFKYSMQKVRELASKEMEGSVTYKQQLFALLDFYANYVFNPPIAGGCPLLNNAVEADDFRTSMRHVVVKELVRTVDFIAGLLSKGIKAKEFKKDIKPHELAYSFFCSVEGAIVFSRIERSREPMDIVVRHCKSIVEQISI
ncbi:MAG TPA: TetR/AcrR family transcriptional regulator [Cyclobacteriaceae bacterium]